MSTPSKTSQPAPRVTLKQIADLSEVSKATVSRALNHQPEVSKETAARVIKAARKLGYKPDPALRALAKYRWQSDVSHHCGYSIALVEIAETRRIPEEVTEGFFHRAEELNIHSEHFFLLDFKTPQDIGRVLYHRGYDGLVARVAKPMLDWKFPWERFAVVTIGFDHPSHRLHSVCSDWAGAVDEAFLRMLQAGAKRPAFMHFQHEHPTLDRIILGAMLASLADSGRLDEGFPPAIFKYDRQAFSEKGGWHSGSFDPETRNRFEKWLTKHSPDAIIDGNAVGCWWLDMLGIKCPRDLLYCSILDAGEGPHGSFPGTDHCYDVQAAVALDKVLSLLELNQRGMSSHPRRSLIECSWRETSVPRKPEASVPLRL